VKSRRNNQRGSIRWKTYDSQRYPKRPDSVPYARHLGSPIRTDARRPAQQPTSPAARGLAIVPESRALPKSRRDRLPFSPYASEAPSDPSGFISTGKGAADDESSTLMLCAASHLRSWRSGTCDAGRHHKPWRLGNPDDPGRCEGQGQPYQRAESFSGIEMRTDRFLHRRYWHGTLRDWINLLREEHIR